MKAKPQEKAVILYLNKEMVEKIDKLRKQLSYTRKRYIEIVLQEHLSSEEKRNA